MPPDLREKPRRPVISNVRNHYSEYCMIWDILIPAATGLVTGAIGSLAAPWAQWGVEKTRIKHEARVALIAAARQVLTDPPSNQQFRLLPVYSQLRRHLSPGARSAVEGEHDEVIQIVMGHSRHSGVNPYSQRVLDEVAKLEESWGLL